MYRNSSRFNVALILGALVLVAPLLTGCGTSMRVATLTATPAPKATWTPVPLATWVAQGIPADTVITWEGFLGGPLRPDDWGQIVVNADGTVTCVDNMGEKWIGRIPQDKLRQILLQFAQVDFFSLAYYAPGCVYRAYDPPDLAHMPTLLPMPDAGLTTISITINGRAKSVRHYQFCQDKQVRELESMIVGAAWEQFRQTHKATPAP